MISEVGKGVIFFLQMLRVWKRKSISRALMFEQIWKVTTQSAATTGMAGFLWALS